VRSATSPPGWICDALLLLTDPAAEAVALPALAALVDVVDPAAVGVVAPAPADAAAVVVPAADAAAVEPNTDEPVAAADADAVKQEASPLGLAIMVTGAE